MSELIFFDSIASRSPRKWLDLYHKNFIESGRLYIDFRVKVIDALNQNELMQIGGIYHKWAGTYISKEEELNEYKRPIQTVWYMSPPQVRLFSLLPLVLDRNREYPISQIQVRGGRRSGKTEGAVRFALAFCVINTYAKVGMFGLDYKSNNEMLAKIQAVIPEEWISSYDKKHSTLYFMNGSSIVFFSQRNYKKAGRSYSFDLVLLDEPTYYDNTAAVLEGCKGATVEYDGCIISVYTPPPIHETMYFEEKKSMSSDEALRASIKTIYYGSSYDNIFLSEKAKRKIKLAERQMTNSEYAREILGKYSKTEGTAIYDFNKDIHVLHRVPEYLVDITRYYCEERWDISAEYICGMDFNVSPMTFVAFKLYWSPSGGTLVAHYELYDKDTNTDKFLHRKIIPWLNGVFNDNSTQEEKVQKVVIVADASAWWQGAGGQSKKYGDVTDTAYRILSSAGFKVIQPKSMVRRVNKNVSNRSRYGANPARMERLECLRSRILDRYNNSHIFFLDGCKNCIESMEKMPLARGGIPDIKSEYCHMYDALSYVVYNLYPKFQLSNVDEDELTKTYEIVHRIGKEKLSNEEKDKHPIVASTGKYLLL